MLALFGLAVAMYCVDALVGLGSVRPDRLLHLPSVRDHVGHFLNQLAAPGSTAGLALLCGLGAMLPGDPAADRRDRAPQATPGDPRAGRSER